MGVQLGLGEDVEGRVCKVMPSSFLITISFLFLRIHKQNIYVFVIFLSILC